MDEEVNGFPIPANRPMFGEPEGGGEFIVSFANEAGDKAVVLTTVEVIDGETVEQHTRGDLEGYAQGLMDGEEDTMGLQIGDIFEGETAEADASAEADRLNTEYDPGADATDEDLIAAVDAAKGDTVVEEENELAEAESFPGDLGEGEDIGAPELDTGIEVDEEEPEEVPTGEDIESEPVFGQLMKKKKSAV